MRLGFPCALSHWQVRFAILLSAVLFCPGASFAQANPPPADNQTQQGSADKADKAGKADKDKNGDKPSEPAMAKLRIHVATDTDKPVANASVYVRFYTTGGLLHHDKLAEMNFKTNEDGSVKVPEVPQGKILIQVIATGWHTYGKWYDIQKDQESIDIRLVPPPHWY